MRKVDPTDAPKQKTQNKSRKTTVDKNTSMSIKFQNTPPNDMNIRSTPNTSMSLPPLDYNIVDDMKKNRANISLFELARIQSQQSILLCALGQTVTDSAASASKGASTPPWSLSIVLNMLQMEEENSDYHPFLLSFKIFDYNDHNCLVDYGAAANIMPLSIAKHINAQWSETSTRIILLDQTLVPAIGELRHMIIWLSHDSRFHQFINIVIVDIPEAYGLLLYKD